MERELNTGPIGESPMDIYVPAPGEKIEDAAKHMVALAKERKLRITAEFNGTVIEANEDSDYVVIVNNFIKQRKPQR